ncbi:uncharacterized protein LOC135943679 [Cloeon dipterum]|uniref:uncharacterized protein LOC135943679 n=1 Tax=Cloeon dipterum TaxID=197152 RepID=UPI0032202834
MEDKPPLEKDEYEIRFYDRAVRELYREVEYIYFNSANDAFSNMAKLVKKQLGEAKKDKVDHIDRNYDLVSKRVVDETKKQLGALQNMMEQKIFHIPDDVVLPEDMCQMRYANTTGSKVDQQFDQILGRFEAVRFLKSAVNDEIQCFENLFPHTQALCEDIEKCSKRIESNLVKPSTLEQLLKVENLL